MLQFVVAVSPITAYGQKGAARTVPNVPGTASTIFINEILYDVTGTDTGEFVEVAGPAGTDLTGWTIVLYNGGGTPAGQSYDTDALPTPIPSQAGGYGTVAVTYASNGVQNGAPDGIALVNGTTVVQFLCYEGSFTASNGPASGLTCTDIGVSQSGTNAVGTSLQLQGSGTTYGNFTWNATSIANTQNAPNTGQTFMGGPPVDNPPTVASTNPADNAVNVGATSNISVTFSEPVTATTSSFQISCATSGTHAFNLSGGPTTYTLDPTTNFTAGEVCTVTVVAAQVADQDGTPNNMAQDFIFDFTIAGGPPTPIHTVQGSGTASPIVGQVVTTTGVVTLLKTTTNTGGAADHFFLQTPDADADADPNTSQGILVFTSAVPTVAVSDEVNVTGTVEEFFGMTRITSVTNVSVIDTGNPLPTPVTLTTTILDPSAASAAQPQLEKFEGMRLSATSLTTVAPNDNFYDVDTVITGVPRPLREPGIDITQPVPPDPTSGMIDPNIPRWDKNPERIVIDTNGRSGAALNPYTSNVILSNIAGPLDFTFSRYRLITESTPAATGNISAVPVPTPMSNEFTVAGFNIENFNNAATQRQKAALAIRDVMHLPHIIGHAEIFELTGLQALATEVNSISPGRTYQAYLEEADNTSGDADQDVAFLVDTSRVEVNSVVQEELAGCVGTAATCNTFTNPNNGQQELLNDRPPLVLNANIDPSGANLPVIVVVNHTRSFIDIEAVAGEGPRVRAKRKAQAEFLANLLQNLQTANPTTSVISVGDYNAYQFSDGYTDPIATIKGNPTPDDQIVVDQSPDVVDPNFVNLIDELPPSEQYSFIFEGTPQALDHVIINTVANARRTRIAIARNNADFPEVPAATYESNTARPERNSDHDMPVAYFSLGGAQPAGSVIISEFRLRGPDPSASPVPIKPSATQNTTKPSRGGTPLGATAVADNNEFIEIYNNTDADIVVATTDGSSGWSLVGSDGVARFEIPIGTTIPARGHFLGVQGNGYSLANYGGTNAAQGDVVYFNPIPDNGGVALFRTSNSANFTMESRLDAVGYADAGALYREGAGLPTGGPEFDADTAEFSFVRSMAVPVMGLPKDTGDNSNDFIGVSTDGEGTGLGMRLGAPGPENIFSPIQRNGLFGVTNLDPGASTSASPNRVRVQCASAPECNPTTAQNGTLSFRRTVTNNSTVPVSRLRFRIIDISTFPRPSTGTADLRALTSSNVMVTLTGGAQVPVSGTTLEMPPAQPLGGGWNSSWLAGTIDFSNPLPAGSSVDVQFVLGVQQTGVFRFFFNVEAGDDPDGIVTSPVVGSSVKTTAGRYR